MESLEYHIFVYSLILRGYQEAPIEGKVKGLFMMFLYSIHSFNKKVYLQVKPSPLIGKIFIPVVPLFGCNLFLYFLVCLFCPAQPALPDRLIMLISYFL